MEELGKQVSGVMVSLNFEFQDSVIVLAPISPTEHVIPCPSARLLGKWALCIHLIFGTLQGSMLATFGLPKAINVFPSGSGTMKHKKLHCLPLR